MSCQFPRIAQLLAHQWAGLLIQRETVPNQKVISGSKQVTVVVKILMAILITIAKDIKVTQVVAVNVVPPVEVTPRTQENFDDTRYPVD